MSHSRLSKDRWNLSSLFHSDKDYYKILEDFPFLLKKYEEKEKLFTLKAKPILDILEAYYQISEFLERISSYASLRLSEDLSSHSAKELYSQMIVINTQWAEKSSCFWATLAESSESDLRRLIEDPLLKSYKIPLKEVLRNKKHTLSPKEERILALQLPVSRTGASIFSQLTNADFSFGEIETPDQKREILTQGNFGVLLENENKDFRKKVYQQFYQVFDNHKNSLCESLNSSVKQNWFITQARHYDSTLERSLFNDAIPLGVYENLLDSVKDLLPTLHDYYRLKAKAQGASKITHADVYVPFLSHKWNMSYEEAVQTVVESLEPLGKDYQDTLKQGLLSGWVDRYERPGKRSGAFSSGSYTSSPYILMNYKETSLRDLYTLAHEAGHSMHTLYTAKNNPYPTYRYAIFEAEVASTFNEQLLTNYLLKKYSKKEEQEFILAKNLDDFVATFFRQTMFAEFEKTLHSHIQQGKALTPEGLKAIYGNLQKNYFGDTVEFFENSWIECLRIPHFYSPFYVYQYATGLTASLYLSKEVIEKEECKFYIDFLKRGGSVSPFESLKMAGVDLSNKQPIKEVGQIFKSRLEDLKKIMGV